MPRHSLESSLTATWHFAMLVGLVLGPTALAAQAICPEPIPKVCSEYFASDAVFVGRLAGKDYVGEFSERIAYTVQVKETLRGSPRKTQRLVTQNDSARWSGDIGKTYLFFAKDNRIGASCGPTDESGFVPEGIRQIRALRGATRATIEGEVVRRDAGMLVAAGGGVRVSIAGADGERVATTNDSGFFTVDVAPGRYKLSAPSLEWTRLGYHDPADIRLEPGQCAQFRLEQK